jgi:transducin (beta)-like 1
MVASTSKATLDTVEEEVSAALEGNGSHETKRKADAKAQKAEKRVKREETPKLNGRPTNPAESEDEEKAESGKQTTAKETAGLSTPGKKNKRGSIGVKATAAGNGASKADKAASSAYLPPLTGQAKGKQIPSSKIARLKGHNAEVFVTAWNPAVPGLLASGAGDATVRIWDLGTAFNSGSLGDAEPIVPTVCKHLPSTQAKDVSALSWNPDGTLLASGSYDGILRLWTPQGDLHLVMSMHQGPIFAVRWNRRGNYILTGSADGTAIVWDLNSGKVRQQFSSHSDTVLDSDWLTGSMVGNREGEAPSLSADNTFATCSADNSVNVLRLGDAKPLKTLKGHTDEVNAIRFDPTGTLLASVSDDATARIWNMDVILGLQPGVSGNGNRDNDSSNVPKRSSLTPRPTRGGSVDQMDVDDSTSVGDLSGGNANELLSHSSSNGAVNGGGAVCRFVLTGHKKDIFAASWAPHRSGQASDPRLLATASFDNTARIWNAEDGTCLRIFAEHTDSVYSVCFSPDRRFLVTGGIDQRLFISEVATGDIILAHAAGGGIFDMAWHTEKLRKAIEDSSKSKQTIDVVASNEAKETTEQTSADSDVKSEGRDGEQRHYLAVSQRDKMLTILDLSDL